MACVQVLRRQLLLGLLAIGPVLGAVGTAQSTPIDPPPAMLNGHHAGEFFYESSDAHFSMRADFSSGERVVTITSMYRNGLVWHKQSQTQPVRYWPTCVRRGANGELWVAGKGHRTGNTIIEKWTFAPPSLAVLGSPGANPPKSGALLDVKDLYDEAIEGRLLVENMTPQLGGSTARVLVKFHDSKDVYSVGADATVTLIASPVVKPNSFLCPLLANPGTVFTRQLASGGYVYGWRLFSNAPSTDPSIVVLHDDDMNGTVDRAETISGATFDSRQWGRAATWVQ
jgi:hypothetical protein